MSIAGVTTARLRSATSRSCDAEGECDLLDARLESLGKALAAQVYPHCGLWDPESGAPTPPDHYGQLGCALALRLLRPEGSEWWLAEQAWSHLSPAQLGHAPFNRFLLLLQQWHDGAQRPLERCTLQRSYPSNNWTLLAQLCRLLEADGPARQRRADTRLRALLLNWMTDRGGFIDYPAKPPRSGAIATPMAYHHKAVFVAAVAAWHSGDRHWIPVLTKLLDWALLSWDGNGAVGGFGRSNHALFGEACLLAALVLIGGGRTPQGEHLHLPRQIVTRVLQRWQGQVRQDGLLWLNPSDAAARAPIGWDEYMHLSVYNAWTAAILAWARAASATKESPALFHELRLPAALQVLRVDPSAGLLRVGAAADRCALISTRGQPPQAFRQSEVEFRYSGGLLFHLRTRQRDLIPPPIRVPAEVLLQQPALAGWVPLFKYGDALYGLTDFGSIDIQDAPAGLSITAEGQPRALTRQPARGLSGRVLAALDWRLLGGRLGRQHALKRPVLAGVTGRLRLELALERLQFSYSLVLDNNTQAGTVHYLNPAGHALIGDAMPTLRRITGPDQGSIDAMAVSAYPLPSTLPNGQGYCLDSATLSSGRSGYGIELGWSLDRSS